MPRTTRSPGSTMNGSAGRFPRRISAIAPAAAELVLPTEFYQAQMVPDSYQNGATGGSGEKINSLLVREYLSTEHSALYILDVATSQLEAVAPTAHPAVYREARFSADDRRDMVGDGFVDVRLLGAFGREIARCDSRASRASPSSAPPCWRPPSWAWSPTAPARCASSP